MEVNEDLISPMTSQINAFNGIEVAPIEIIVLPVYVTDRILMVTFFIIDTLSVMNVIMDFEWIHVVKWIMSTLY